MKSELSSSPAPEWLGSKDQETTSEMISEIRRGVHTVWGGIGASEERKLRNVLQKLVDDIDVLEKTLSRTVKRPREHDISTVDNKRLKMNRFSEEPHLHNMNSVSTRHIAADAHCKIEKTEDDAELLGNTSFAPVIDLTSGTTSNEESHQATTSQIDAPLDSKTTVKEQCGHENEKNSILSFHIKEEDDESSDEETYGAEVKPQGARQDETLNAIEVWFRDKVHRGHELLGLLALVDFHESNPDECKAGHEICRNLRRKVEVAEQSMGCDWEKTFGPLARAISAHLADAGENLEDVLERFQDHAKKIEPEPDFDDLLLDNAEYIDRFRPLEKYHVYSTGVERLPTPNSKLFLPDSQTTLRSSSCRPHLAPRIVAGTSNKAEQSQGVRDLINATAAPRGHQAIYKPTSSCQQETMDTSRMFSKSKKVHWPTDVKTVANTGKDLSRDRREARRQRRGV
ncbi:hypothetical protein N0V92_004441 [Colletotrichum tropicale]|nr:hypothetical protein N0V92_004441 [Colletotrichum tropicale]